MYVCMSVYVCVSVCLYVFRNAFMYVYTVYTPRKDQPDLPIEVLCLVGLIPASSWLLDKGRRPHPGHHRPLVELGALASQVVGVDFSGAASSRLICSSLLRVMTGTLVYNYCWLQKVVTG